MDTIIQHIETYWTKKSRGNPRATVRNSVPEKYPLMGAPGTRGVFLYKVKYSEYSNFSDPVVSGFRCINDNQQRQLGFKLEVLNGELLVSKWEKRGRVKHFCALKPNTWIKIVTNERTPIEYTWAYYKHVYNIYFGNPLNAEKVLLSQKPSKVLIDEKNLW
ncbi:hypothetical protein L1077_20790 [Pseudoalteromonas luteoviolacea]|uniref:hypothetical protein n=1 Tax=Pseudoalteromonas luteoviolacea TaxID=43657 RepID=UPI001F2A91B2|nr:hypothetical protein [Pseudoalteromonas luteoviolacea]MCF6441878.1 hypothetical protein [Pseudoalteromonas luteoviolacea]